MSRYTRIIIYPKDVAIITGKSERYGRIILSKIRSHHGKQPHQLVTVKEFCDFIGLEVSEITSFLI